MSLYLDTSVLAVYLFGRDREPVRYPHTLRLFDEINTGHTDGLVSLYSLQEVFTFCQDNFPEEDAQEVAALAFEALFQNRLRVCGMLTRQQKIQHARQFPLKDSSDLPHAITAYLQQCDALVTYDRHFDAIAEQIVVFTPEKWLASQEKS